CTAWFAYW
nr:immunoglobulin heavy chain junction region [Mus musculus]MBK4187232.1 immunoglobulin heavy chain junction region [Mus musculus]MBK4187233.1 immunoglobulin heavy chain junction region [Mus musculus]